ncbi:MAG: DUF2085 domain-containing protein [Candidatus Lokiarchaeota archaeon]|nr:DUF2085 domain-containing protein [Candidatus Lokiarchaeota archaeon]
MKIEYISQQPTSKLHTVAVNSLITIFITMSYLYISEIFGSISSPYINQNNLDLLFGATLFIYIFFSILAGPIQAFISGFLGELFYQLVYYNTIIVYWCFFVGLLGVINSLYKYKPLKYQNLKPILYTFLIFVINSFLAMILIILYKLFLNSGLLSIEEIVINFGLKFIIQSLLSIVIFIPIALIIYDKLLSKRERHLYYLLLTHHPLSASDHTFSFQFGRTKIYFCTRCSGMIIGLILSIFFVHLIEGIFNSEFDPLFALLLIIILPIPGLIDWGTQRLLLRTSSTSSRIFTGFIIGVAMHLISFTKDYYFITLIVITIYFSILFFLIYIGQKRLLKRLNEELTPQPPDNNNREIN